MSTLRQSISLRFQSVRSWAATSLSHLFGNATLRLPITNAPSVAPSPISEPSSDTAASNPSGQSAQAELSSEEQNAAAQWLPVSTTTLPVTNSANPAPEKHMKLSLSSLTNAISAAIVAEKVVLGSAQIVFNAVGGLVSAAETAYTGAVNAGSTKKAAVLAAAEALAVDVGADFKSIVDDVSALIDVSVAAYKSVVAAADAPTPAAAKA